MTTNNTEQKELFNQEVIQRLDNSLYVTTLLEQWKTANELTTHISAQRNNINNFYISLLSLLIGGILLSDQLMIEQAHIKTVILLLILVVGIACCVTWVQQVDKCKRINYQKYQIIEQLEQQLPANVLSYEGYIPTLHKKSSGDRALSDYEKLLANIFGITITLIVLTMLLEVWWVSL